MSLTARCTDRTRAGWGTSRPTMPISRRSVMMQRRICSCWGSRRRPSATSTPCPSACLGTSSTWAPYQWVPIHILIYSTSLFDFISLIFRVINLHFSKNFFNSFQFASFRIHLITFCFISYLFRFIIIYLLLLLLSSSPIDGNNLKCLFELKCKFSYFYMWMQFQNIFQFATTILFSATFFSNFVYTLLKEICLIILY